MKILAIETSCDETSASLIEANVGDKKVKLLSNVVSSSINLHAKTGGIIPEVAAREQVKYIIPVIKQAMENARPPATLPIQSQVNQADVAGEVGRGRWKMENIDTIAVTVGPGLIGSLLVGVETAKTLSYVWNKPIIPVNHLFGHIYANFISTINYEPSTINFPTVALIVSGGHTDLVLMKNHGNIKWLGGTRDDAAGEALDKIGRLLNLPYPAGPTIEKLAERGNASRFKFPSPMIYSKDFDFSFSGLKTAVWREAKTISKLNNETIANICASTQQAIINVLVAKTLKAAQQYKVKSILLGGGVAANEKLRNQFALEIRNLKLEIPLSVPSKNLCTDNGAMIGAAAFFNYKPLHWSTLSANPELYFDNSY